MAQKIQRKPQIDQTMKKIFKSNFQPKYGYFGKTMCTVVAIQGDFRPKKFFWPKKNFFFSAQKKKNFFFLGPTVGPQSPTVGLQSPTDGPLSPSVGLRGSDCRTQGVSPLFTHSKHDRPHRAHNKKKRFLNYSIPQSTYFCQHTPPPLLPSSPPPFLHQPREHTQYVPKACVLRGGSVST